LCDWRSRRVCCVLHTPQQRSRARQPPGGTVQLPGGCSEVDIAASSPDVQSYNSSNAHSRTHIHVAIQNQREPDAVAPRQAHHVRVDSTAGSPQPRLDERTLAHGISRVAFEVAAIGITSRSRIDANGKSQNRGVDIWNMTPADVRGAKPRIHSARTAR